jgi:tripartite-type tricarboxylate transporter receptor subunit TctC
MRSVRDLLLLVRWRALMWRPLKAFFWAAVCMSVIHATAHAQDFSPKQITVVVGFPAAGGTDLFARLFAQKLAAGLGAGAIVDNRPGAAGTLGTNAVVRAAPNGQTLLFTPSTIAMTKALYEKLPFDPQHDLAPVIMTARIPFVLVVHPSLPVRNVKEFLALAKRKPGALDYGSSGPGSPPHFAMELLKTKAAIDIHHVPYKGAGQITTGLLSGEVQTSFLIPPVSQPHMQSGKVRGLAVSTRNRSSAFPDLPSLHEAGVAEFEVTQWHAFFAPAKTPAHIIARLNAEIVKALSAPDVRQRLAAEGADVVGSTPAELAAHLASEITVYTGLAQRLGLKPE